MKLIKYFHYLEDKIDMINSISALNGFQLAVSGLILGISMREFKHIDKLLNIMSKIEKRMNLILQQTSIEREIDRAVISDMEKSLKNLKTVEN